MLPEISRTKPALLNFTGKYLLASYTKNKKKYFEESIPITGIFSISAFQTTTKKIY